MKQGGQSREGMNFWYDRAGNHHTFYAQYGNSAIRYEIDLAEEEAKVWRKNVYARAEKHFGIKRKSGGPKTT